MNNEAYNDFIITGFRGPLSQEQEDKVWETLKNQLTFADLIIQGGAAGVDKLAKSYAIGNNIAYCTAPANWGKLGASAGPVRNKHMLKMFPEAVVLAFPHKESKGTRGCVKLAKELGMFVIVTEI